MTKDVTKEYMLKLLQAVTPNNRNCIPSCGETNDSTFTISIETRDITFRTVLQQTDMKTINRRWVDVLKHEFAQIIVRDVLHHHKIK